MNKEKETVKFAKNSLVFGIRNSTTPRCNPHLQDKPTVGKPPFEF